MKEEVFIKTRLTESYWPAGLTESKPLLEKTMQQVLRDTAATFPDRIALVEGVSDPAKRRRWTYDQLLTDVERVASALLKRFKPGERLAVWSPNRPEWVLLEFGCAMAGITLVTINPVLKAKEMKYILENSQSQGIFCDKEFRGYDMLGAVNEIRKEVSLLREVLCFSDFNEFINSGNKSNAFPEVKPQDPFMVMYTSGTTGSAKGALLRHQGVINSALYAAERAGMDEGGVWINAMPMFHVGGCGMAIIGTVLKHGTTVLLPGFDPLLWCELVQSEKGTFALLVPTMWEMILSHPDYKKYDFTTLKSAMTGGSKVSESLARRIISEFGVGLSNMCGMTEVHGVITSTHREDTIEDQYKTVGQPYPHAAIKIIDTQTGKVLPVGQQGEIVYGGDMYMMIGYYNKPQETADLLKDGWMHSGDLGIMDERGFLSITGRLKDQIIRGGEKIDSIEVEHMLLENPLIAKAAVVGVPDPQWGEQVGAVIVLKSPDKIPTVEELDAYASANIAGFKRPKLWYVTDEFPYTASAKLQKFVLVDKIKSGALMPIK
ncbi:MAG: class I adenylate-forming enzyme family protein [Smithellaceae bacterium]